MADDLASANVNRSYSLAAMSLAIFTFLLFFLYPRFRNGEIDPWMFQATLVVMGFATFSFVFASFHYYSASLCSRFDEVERALYQHRADRLWVVGYTLLFFVPSMILVTVGLFAVASAWFVLWLAYVAFEIRYYPKIETMLKMASRGEGDAGLTARRD
jgi:hypothetical protein